MRHDYHDTICKIWNESRSVYKSCKIFAVNIYLVKNVLYNMHNSLQYTISTKSDLSKYFLIY